MKKQLTAAALFAGVSVAVAANANAADFYMGGVLGGTPGFNTMTGPTGQKCDSGLGGSCKRISYDNLSTQSAEKNLAAQLAKAGPSGNTIWVYSLSSTAAVDYINKHPEDKNTWILVGSPAKPNNGATAAQGGRTVTNPTADLTFVSKSDDVVAIRTSGTTNAHLNGYKNLDASKPTTSTVVPGTNVKDNVYVTPPKQKVTLASIVQGWKESAAQRKAERAERKAEREAAREERKAAKAEKAEESKAEADTTEADASESAE